MISTLKIKKNIKDKRIEYFIKNIFKINEFLN